MSSSRVGGPAGRRRTFRRNAWIAAAVGALVALSVVSAAGAARPGPVAPAQAGKFTPVNVPLGVSNKPQTVIVQLAGDPVTVSDANSAAPFTQGQWDSHRDQLKSEQAPVTSQIRQLGGQVLGTYQLAYNGIKVRIAANKAEALESVPSVVAVHPVDIVKPDNVHGVPLVGGPAVWGGSPSFAGEHIKIADIDTGIDYTHADFGGSGNPLDYTNALASDTLPANPAWFGPGAPKVKGGIDLVGDDYNADPNSSAFQPIPASGPEPARLQRPRHAHRRHDGRLRRPVERSHVHGPVQRDDRVRELVERRPGRRSEGRPLCGPRLRLRRLDRRRRRRDRVGRCEPHGRDQHVARLPVRLAEQPRRGCVDECRA